jgi:hypothetical protein
MPKENDQNDEDKKGKHGEHKGMQKAATKPGHYPPQKIKRNDVETDQSKQSKGLIERT